MGTATTELQEEGYKLMGAAFEVYNEQGYGLAEEIYQESLEIELEAIHPDRPEVISVD